MNAKTKAYSDGAKFAKDRIDEGDCSWATKRRWAERANELPIKPCGERSPEDDFWNWFSEGMCDSGGRNWFKTFGFEDMTIEELNEFAEGFVDTYEALKPESD